MTAKNFGLVKACAANFDTSVRLLASSMITNQDFIDASNCQTLEQRASIDK